MRETIGEIDILMNHYNLDTSCNWDLATLAHNTLQCGHFYIMGPMLACKTTTMTCQLVCPLRIEVVLAWTHNVANYTMENHTTSHPEDLQARVERCCKDNI